jgi:vacuolar protein sorting-associated protein IST1
LVDAYLYEIAKGYGVNWQPEPEDDEAKPSGEVPNPVEGDGRDSDDDSEGGPGVAEKAEKKEAIPVPELADAKNGDNVGEENKAKQSETPAQPVQAKKLSPEEELAQRFDRLKKL